MSAQFDGFGTGMVAGGLVGLGLVANKAIDNAVAHQRAVGTVHRWSQALDRATIRAVQAERKAARQALEIEALHARLQNAQFELDILRNA